MRGSQRKAQREVREEEEGQEGAGNEDEEEDAGFLVRRGDEEISEHRNRKLERGRIRKVDEGEQKGLKGGRWSWRWMRKRREKTSVAWSSC